MKNLLSKKVIIWVRSFVNNRYIEASHIDFVHEKRHMDVGGWGGVGACDVSR